MTPGIDSLLTSVNALNFRQERMGSQERIDKSLVDPPSVLSVGTAKDNISAQKMTQEHQTPKKYKCSRCHSIINQEDLLPSGACPQCEKGDLIQEMCSHDHAECSHDLTQGIAYCPECGAPCCPECGCHDVAQISRVTGYLQDVEGWNAGKQQELKDRKRYEVTS
jgi:hypothetical protein